MNARGGFGSRIIDAIERLVALCRRQACPNEEVVRSNRKRLSQRGEELGRELPGGIEQ